MISINVYSGREFLTTQFVGCLVDLEINRGMCKLTRYKNNKLIK